MPSFVPNPSQRLLLVIALLITLVSTLFATTAQAQEPVTGDSEPEFQSDEARQEIEKAANPPARNPEAMRTYPQLRGINPLFAGVDDAAIPGQTTDPAVGTWTPLFSGIQIWGAAYDYDDDILYISEGSFLSQYIFATSTLTDVAAITSSVDAASLVMEGLAYYNGTLYGARVGNTATNPEGIYTINQTTGVATLAWAHTATANQTLSGLDADPDTGILYGTNDVTSTTLRGLVRVNPDGTNTQIANYPAGETDIDGLAVGDGKAYLIEDDSTTAGGVVYIYDFDVMTYTGTINLPWPTSEVFAAGAWLLGPSGPTPTPSPTTTPGGPTLTPTATPQGPTATATVTATPGSGNRFCSTVPITIPDANPTGATGTINVPSSATISDLNVIITGTHTWVGDIRLNISNGTTNVTFYDQPGVPASTFGCSGDNLPGVVADDEGVNGSFENSCQNATPAYTPGGSYTNNNALSAFDGANTNATWTLTASDLAAGDTGVINSWCVEFGTGAGPTPTVTPSPTVPGQVPDINVNPSSFNETHSSPPQVTTDTMNIGNTGNATLTWTITEDDSRPFANPNPAQPRDPNAPTQRLGTAGGATTGKLELGPIVGDGSFETGTPNASWEEFSTNFGTPLCDAVCGTGGGTGPRTGAWWAWFGGTTAAETGIITQSVTIPSGSAELTFWLEIPATATGTNGFLSVRMDGTEVFRAEETTTGYATYAEVSVDVSAYADGGSHDLVFFSITDAGAAVTNFFVDDVAITAQAGGLCTAPTAIPWLTVSPANGSTAGGGSTPTTLTYNSASLAQGVYTGTLCIASNDPDEALVTVPVTLNVGPPTAIDLASFTTPMNGFNPADLAAAGLLLLAGAVLVLRRK